VRKEISPAIYDTFQKSPEGKRASNKNGTIESSGRIFPGGGLGERVFTFSEAVDGGEKGVGERKKKLLSCKQKGTKKSHGCKQVILNGGPAFKIKMSRIGTSENRGEANGWDKAQEVARELRHWSCLKAQLRNQSNERRPTKRGIDQRE